MYAFLLILGAVATAAGFALIASGVPVHEFGLGGALIISGTIAAVGGVLLVGIALAVRELQRIERALAGRPATRPARPAEAATSAASSGARSSQPARIPFPRKPKPETAPPAEPPVATAPLPAPTPPPAEETALDRLRQKFPSLGRLESAPVVEATEVSLSPRTPPRADDDAEDRRNGSTPPRTNGADPSEPGPRLEASARPPPAAAPERTSKVAVFDSFWPKESRRGRQDGEQPRPADEPATPAANVEPDPAAAARQPDQQVSILKSGVVDGMAYTLYSDGSIEAQLPQGTVRFGSITELRLHLEKHG
jgi:hypothetical protein